MAAGPHDVSSDPYGEPFWGLHFTFPTPRSTKTSSPPSSTSCARSSASSARIEEASEQNRSALMHACPRRRGRRQGGDRCARARCAAIRSPGISNPVHGAMRFAPKFPPPIMAGVSLARRPSPQRRAISRRRALARAHVRGLESTIISAAVLLPYSVDERWLTPAFLRNAVTYNGCML